MYNKTNMMERNLSELILFLAVAIAIWLPFTLPVHAESITLDVTKTLGPVNRSFLGMGIPAAHSPYPANLNGAGIWNPDSIPPTESGLVTFAPPKTIGMHFARYGTGLDDNWKDAVGLIANRPTNTWFAPELPLTYTQKIVFGLPEFLKVCQDIGTAPVILLSQNPSILKLQDAADLVEYLNAPSGTNPNGGTAWADTRDADRIALGLEPGPWNVVWFEYGNEVYKDDPRTGFTIPLDQYVSNYLQYQAAMKAVSPNIKLGAVLNSPSTMQEEWSTAVMLGTGSVADFFIAHSYVMGYNGNGPDSKTLFSIEFAGADAQLQSQYQKLNRLIYELTGRVIPVAVTEFNGGFEQKSLGNALVNAEQIRQFMQAENIVMALNHTYSDCYWGLVKTHGCVAANLDVVPVGSYVKRPNFYLFDIYNNHFGDTRVNAQVVAPTSYPIPSFIFYNNWGVELATNVHQDEIVNSIDVLAGQLWNLASPVPGANASQSPEVLSIAFAGSTDVDYAHATKSSTSLTPGGWYRLTGAVNTSNLTTAEGIALDIESGANMVLNNGFENGYTSWTKSSTDPAGVVTRIDSGTAHSGTSSFRMDFDASKGDPHYYHLFQNGPANTGIPVDGDTTYVIEGYIKTADLTNPPGLHLEVQDASGYLNGTWTAPDVKSGNNEWTRVNLTFKTQPDTKAVRVFIHRYPGTPVSGTAWFDDIRLTNKVDTKEYVGTNGWRYLSADFRLASGTSTATVVARRYAGGVVSGDAQLRDVKLRQITAFGNHGAVPNLSVNASKSQDGSKAYLMVVNKSMDTDIFTPITITGDTPTSAQSWTLNGSAVDSTNEAFDPSVVGAIPPVSTVFRDIGPVSDKIEYSFPAHSLTALEISLKGFPDLVVSTVGGPANGTTGKGISVNATTANTGRAASAVSTTALYLSTDATIASSDISLGTVSIGSLAAGATSPNSVSVTLPSTLVTGAYYLGAIADAAGAVVEGNATATGESNNAKTGNVIQISGVPAAPSNLTATVNSRSKITLNWTDNATDESGFRIERSIDGTTFDPIAKLEANVKTYTNYGLSANTVYYYRIRAYNARGNSTYCNTVSARTNP